MLENCFCCFLFLIIKFYKFILAKQATFLESLVFHCNYLIFVLLTLVIDILFSFDTGLNFTIVPIKILVCSVSLRCLKARWFIFSIKTQFVIDLFVRFLPRTLFMHLSESSIDSNSVEFSFLQRCSVWSQISSLDTTFIFFENIVYVCFRIFIYTSFSILFPCFRYFLNKCVFNVAIILSSFAGEDNCFLLLNFDHSDTFQFKVLKRLNYQNKFDSK